MAPSAGTLRVGRYFAALLALLVVLYAIVFWPGQRKTPKLGLDLEGGAQVVLQAKTDAGKQPSKAAMRQARTILDNRVNGLGVSNAEVVQQGNDRIVISVPGKQGNQLKDVSQAALLEFRPLLQQPTAAAAPATTVTPSASPSASGKASTSAKATGSSSATVAPGSSPAASSAPSIIPATPKSTPAASSAAPAGSASQSAQGEGVPLAAAGTTSTPAAAGATSSPAAASTPSTGGAAVSSKVGSASPGATGASATGASAGATGASASGAATPSAGNTTAAANPAPEGAVNQWAKLGFAPPTTPAALAALNATQSVALTALVNNWNCKSTPLDQPTLPLITCDQADTAKYLLGPVIVKGTEVSGASAQSPDPSTGSLNWSVNLSLKSKGQAAWADYTSKHNKNVDTSAASAVAFTLDAKVITAPTIDGTINGNTQITGGYTQKTANDLANSLKYGALPLNFNEQDATNVSATLGSSQLKAGLLAGGIGLFLVVVYSLLYYRALGLVTIASLLVSGALTYGMLVLLGTQINFTLTLAGIAGFIVAVGITADSFVVFFERIKDEVHDGRSARVGVPRAWIRARRTIISADSVSLLAAVILYYFAAGDVRGFAFTLGLSTALDLIVVFLFTHPLVSLLSRSQRFGNARLSGLNSLRVPRPDLAYASVNPAFDAGHEPLDNASAVDLSKSGPTGTPPEPKAGVTSKRPAKQPSRSEQSAGQPGQAASRPSQPKRSVRASERQGAGSVAPESGELGEVGKSSTSSPDPVRPATVGPKAGASAAGTTAAERAAARRGANLAKSKAPTSPEENG